MDQQAHVNSPMWIDMALLGAHCRQKSHLWLGVALMRVARVVHWLEDVARPVALCPACGFPMRRAMFRDGLVCGLWGKRHFWPSCLRRDGIAFVEDLTRHPDYDPWDRESAARILPSIARMTRNVDARRDDAFRSLREEPSEAPLPWEYDPLDEESALRAEGYIAAMLEA